ncbi:junctophilin-1-like [Hippocampus comes]|uniref:Junctophilin 1b n=1 Tax=Hippocampus comes TaxID=109280 RepID=A0A3Q2XYQ4_HIPCM|nr:PREDICTED: junctophilin-1-like [Hippocampus comes]
MTGGRFDFDDGGTYCGGWEDGKAHGQGVCTGSEGRGEYSGSWSGGFEAVGVYTWPSGNVYRGDWAQGKRHGLGAETKGKWLYRGEWTRGLKGRYGVRQSLSTPARYEGTWSNGLQDGYGVETYSDGGTYQGQWSGGMRHGYGVRQSVPYGVASLIRSPLRTSLGSLRSEGSNGALLAGAASDGPAGTRGGFVLNFPSDGEAGEKKRGLFRRGSLFGSLQRLRKSESRSSVSSKRSSAPSETALSGISSSDGNSTGSFGDGDPAEDDWTPEDDVDAAVTESYAGEWKNDKRNGLGVSERSDGLKYQGEWLNNKRHGYGATVFPGGAAEEGKYKNNVLARGIRKQFIPLKDAKTKRKVDRAMEGAARAAAVARTKVEIAISRTSHTRAKAEAADRAAQSASRDSDIARALARDLSPSFHQPGPDYIRQKSIVAAEAKDVLEECQLQKTPPSSPHFYRKGTTPTHSPRQSPAPSPSASPTGMKTTATGFGAGGPSKPPGKGGKTSTAEPFNQGIAKAAWNLSLGQEARQRAESCSVQAPVPNSRSAPNGQIHCQYHGYYVKDVKTLPPEEPLDAGDDFHPSSLARLPPPAKPAWAPAPKVSAVAGPSPLPPKENAKAPAESSGPKAADSNKPKSFAETKKASVEIGPEMVRAESGPDSILVALVMLLNVSLAVLFVHFLT